MGWKDRVTGASIETPDKKLYVFEFGDLEKTTTKKTSKHRSADIDGTLVQDFGIGEVSFPLIMYFSGENYDLTAKAFDKSAGEKGVCKLEHPLYGIKNVVIESIQRRDAIRSAGGQAIYTLVITETIIEVIPSTGDETDFGILSTLDDFYSAVADAYNDSFLADTVNTAVEGAARVEAFVNEFTEAVSRISSTVDEISSTIRSVSQFITRNITTLLDSPLELATSLQTLIKAPAQAVASVQQRLKIYKDIYQGLLTTPDSSNTQDSKNQAVEKELILGSLLATMCDITLNPDTSDTVDTGFATKADATAAASELIDSYYEIQNYLDELQIATEGNNLNNAYAVSSESAEQLRLAVALTVGNLVRLSFDLDQERIFTLTSEMNLLALSYKLYGTSVGVTLDKLIATNQLTGDDIVMVPEGTDIKYYV